MAMAALLHGLYCKTPYSRSLVLVPSRIHSIVIKKTHIPIPTFGHFGLSPTPNPDTTSTFANLDFFIYTRSTPTTRSGALAFAALTWPRHTAYSTTMSRPCCYSCWICTTSSAVKTLTIARCTTAEVRSRRIRLTAVSTSHTKGSFERSHSLLEHLILGFHDLHLRPIGRRVSIVLHCGENALVWRLSGTVQGWRNWRSSMCRGG